MESNYTSDKLYQLAEYIVKNPLDNDRYKEWSKAISKTSTETLFETISILSSNRHYTPANIKALRESIKSVIEHRNSQLIVETLHNLDKSAKKLSNASMFLTILGVIIALIQVLQGFF